MPFPVQIRSCYMMFVVSIPPEIVDTLSLKKRGKETVMEKASYSDDFKRDAI